MSAKTPDTRTIAISEVKRTLSSLANEIYRGETRVLIEKSGIPVAALVSARDLERLAQLDEQREERWQIFESMRAPFRGVPVEEIEREAAKAIANVRADKRGSQDELFAIIDEMRESFKDVPPEEIERNAVAIVRKLRTAEEADIATEEQITVERRPA